MADKKAETTDSDPERADRFTWKGDDIVFTKIPKPKSDAKDDTKDK